MIWCKDKLESSFEFICSVVWPTLMKCLFMISAMFLGSVISESFSDRQMSVDTYFKARNGGENRRFRIT